MPLRSLQSQLEKFLQKSRIDWEEMMPTWLSGVGSRGHLGLDAGHAARLPGYGLACAAAARAGRRACCSRGGTRWPPSAPGTCCTPCAANSRHTLCGTRPHMRKMDNLHGIIGGVDCLRAPAQAVGLVAVALELASRLLLLALAAHLP